MYYGPQKITSHVQYQMSPTFLGRVQKEIIYILLIGQLSLDAKDKQRYRSRCSSSLVIKITSPGFEPQKFIEVI